jgi:hypothetical protein
MKEPTKIKLTKSIFESILPKEIIYAEVAGTGAMGNSGGIILYIFTEDNLICYETNFREDEDIFKQVDKLLGKYQVRKENTEIELQDKLFNYFYGGMGNYVFVNKNIELEIEEGYFIYKNDKIEYQIRPSVRGVFLQVVYQMENPKTD